VIIKVLDQFEELVHGIDFGKKFISAPDAIYTIISLLSHSSAEVRSKSALVLGSATQNNQPVQERVLASNVLEVFYVRLQIETDSVVLRRVIYALGSAIRGYDAGIRAFLKGEALNLLYGVYQSHKDKALDSKVLVLVLDILNPEMSKLGDEEFSQDAVGRWCGPVEEQCTRKGRDGEVSAMYQLASKRLRCIKLRCA
jgi:hypothetical protein